MLPNKTALRHLRFPDDCSVGRVYVNDNYIRERFVSEARGLVAVPPNRKVKLRLNELGLQQLNWIALLGEDDIDCLSIENTSATDVELRTILKLTGIERLCLQFTKVDGSCFDALPNLQGLSSVSAWWSRMKDVGLHHLARVPTLEILDVSRTPVSDEGVLELVRARGLRIVSLRDTRIGDAAITAFSSLPALQELYLAGTDITDESIATLSRMESLATLDISKTKISQSGYQRLRKALSDCLLQYDNHFAGAQLGNFSVPIL